ncbi:MAG: MBL fold metallo-hydrolase [Candidatus Latescibacteria bacterium]|jgi:sulfur dioxygenase|nr:MBL fold metallo-hydrolase [Candidatus Latescibacterota bacterium]
MNMLFEQLNPHSCRTYLIGLEGSKEVLLIDPVLEHMKDYIELLKNRSLTLTHVIDTHTHADHISGAAALKDITGSTYLMHKNSPSQCVDSLLTDGFEWKLFDEIQVEVMYTPGHTNDSISLIFSDRIFTGDALFLDDGGAGRDDLPGGDPAAHWESLNKFRKLPEYLTVYPAHDYRNRKPSSLKQQIVTNPHLKERTKEEYINYIEDLKLGPADWMKDVLKANYACARDTNAAWIPVDAPACEVKGTLDKGVNEIEVASISAKELENKINSEYPPLLLDVREEKELHDEYGHIQGIVHIPIWKLPQQISELEKDKDREVVTICRSGARANTAAQILTKAGFIKVSVLNGGMVEWNRN